MKIPRLLWALVLLVSSACQDVENPAPGERVSPGSQAPGAPSSGGPGGNGLTGTTSDAAAPPPSGSGDAGAGDGGNGGNGGHGDAGGGGGGDAGSGASPIATRLCQGTSSTKEQYHLMGPATLASGTTFLSDFTARPIGGGFSGKQAVDDCRMHVDGFLTWHGKGALRVEVNPGDDPLDLGTERAELLSMQDDAGHEFAAEGATAVTVFYATSYYFPTSWDGTFLSGDENSWSFVNQFYGWGGLAAGRRSAGGKQMYWLSGPTDGAFTDGGLITLGKWTDFVFQVDYATGAYKVFRRDEGQTKFATVLSGTSADAKSTQYYKEGLYRGPDVNGRTDVLWIGPASRGASFAAVEQASFGTNAGP